MSPCFSGLDRRVGVLFLPDNRVNFLLFEPVSRHFLATIVDRLVPFNLDSVLSNLKNFRSGWVVRSNKCVLSTAWLRLEGISKSESVLSLDTELVFSVSHKFSDLVVGTSSARRQQAPSSTAIFSIFN